MTNLFSVSLRFNGENSQMFKVRYINVTLNGLNDQLGEINQGFNPGDTKRVKYIWYERPTLDDRIIDFSRLELKNDDDLRSMFSIFWQHNMLPWIDMFGMHLPTTTIDLPLKLDKVKPVEQQISSIHPKVILFLLKN
ncbi:40S ribosomal S10-like protein, putative [Medicago truncatula]|uniref:40S ribosomal S10-like protein, putative n=1 Tax=Medicago truncatula TaxID=3880 RepID=G7IQX8_MEDTR|nr:40S ribosomal S10-like protein, putative [Medicago truncatula]